MKTPTLFQKLYPGLTWRMPNDKKIIYLTFDDGPTPFVTNGLLEVLDKFDAKATFFCIGRNVERNPGLYQQIIKSGHAVGNHTYSHLKGWETPDKEYFEDIELASQFIKSDLYRPPYGKITRSQLSYLKKRYRIVMWDVMSRDYNIKLSTQRILQIVNKNVSSGSIVVFHDSLKSKEKIKHNIPVILEKFSSLGFTFASLK